MPPQTYRCLCTRCNGKKLVSRSTFFKHNPGGTGKRRRRAKGVPGGTTDIIPGSAGGPSPDIYPPGPSTDVILEDDADLSDTNSDRVAGSDFVRVTR